MKSSPICLQVDPAQTIFCEQAMWKIAKIHNSLTDEAIHQNYREFIADCIRSEANEDR